MKLSGRKIRVLFVAEGVTMAHVVRPLALARSLRPEEYEIHFAVANGYEPLFVDLPFKFWRIESLKPQVFMRALARGVPPYHYDTLSNYVAEDLSLIERIEPDIIFGDFRLSLPISAKLAGVRYVSLVNAYWSPYSRLGGFPVPDITAVRLFGLKMVSAVYPYLRPFFFSRYAAPINRLRRRHGLSTLQSLLEVYTSGDETLYLDSPTLIPTEKLPTNHRFLGPVVWSPDIPLPEWWDNLPNDRPTVYLSMGSSGNTDVVPLILEVLSGMDVTVLVSTGGRLKIPTSPNVFSSALLPGSAVASRSQVVICNGGSPTVYQAFEQGCPVLGIPSNLDQYLCMKAVEQYGAGLHLRSGNLRRKPLIAALSSIFARANFKQRAIAAREDARRYDGAARFPSVIKELVE